MELMGWIGSTLLALCAVPLCWEAVWNKTIDINTVFLGVWTLGEIFCYIYVVDKQDWPLTFNYFSNILLLIPVWYYKKKR